MVFETTELGDEEPARTLDVLDIHEQKKRFSVKNTHTWHVPSTRWVAGGMHEYFGGFVTDRADYEKK